MFLVKKQSSFKTGPLPAVRLMKFQILFQILSPNMANITVLRNTSSSV